MQFSRAAIMLYLLPNSLSSDVKYVPEILSTMVETEDTKNHALSRTLMRAQLQEERLLDEITEEKVDEKTNADADFLAQVGTRCMYLDGSPGLKCVGVDACKGVTIAAIGCGSCSGDFSCSGLSNTDVGEKSCIGKFSCMNAYSDKIGNNSCNGDKSCSYVKDAKIGNNSCNNRSCPPFPTIVEIGSTVA